MGGGIASAGVDQAPESAVTPDAVNRMLEVEFPGTGNTCVEVSATHALARRDVDEWSIRPGGFVSGPTQFGLADAALWYLTFGVIGRVEPMALTSELSIRFLRPAQGGVVWGRATIESAGSRSIVGSVRIWCDDRDERPSAVAQGTYVLPRR